MSGGRTDAKIDFSLQIFLFTFLGKKWIDLERKKTPQIVCEPSQKASPVAANILYLQFF